MTNRLLKSAPKQQGEKLTPQKRCDLWNKTLHGIEKGSEDQVVRHDIQWVVGSDGYPRLESVETDFDRTMKEIKAGNISQSAIDRLPFNIRRIAWNRGYLNCDYGSPPRYWIPNRKPEGWKQSYEPAALEWYNEPE